MPLLYGIDLVGKTALIAGAGNRWSLGWGITRVLSKAGMTLVLSYSREKRRRGIERMVEEEGMENVVIPPFPCNARDDVEIDELSKRQAHARDQGDPRASA